MELVPSLTLRSAVQRSLQTAEPWTPGDVLRALVPLVAAAQYPCPAGHQYLSSATPTLV